jgi:hypothetical protein
MLTELGKPLDTKLNTFLWHKIEYLTMDKKDHFMGDFDYLWVRIIMGLWNNLEKQYVK